MALAVQCPISHRRPLQRTSPGNWCVRQRRVDHTGSSVPDSGSAHWGIASHTALVQCLLHGEACRTLHMSKATLPDAFPKVADLLHPSCSQSCSDFSCLDLGVRADPRRAGDANAHAARVPSHFFLRRTHEAHARVRGCSCRAGGSFDCDATDCGSTGTGASERGQPGIRARAAAADNWQSTIVGTNGAGPRSSATVTDAAKRHMRSPSLPSIAYHLIGD